MAKEYRSKYKIWITEFFKTHPDIRISAREIHEKMQEAGMKINLVTVYRNLDKLADEKSLTRQKMPEEDENYYQYMQPDLSCGNHLHLICRSCGKIVHLNCDFMDEINGHLMEKHGFAVDCRESMLVGMCRECAEMEKRAKVLDGLVGKNSDT